ncbi:hypothetical protein ACGFZ9_45640 [Streptomyces mirabilis]|uniref:hypothetical protein n=1 Tax=Streptomyces mirabilis TaxID=68239 RepID=UPI0037115BC4
MAYVDDDFDLPLPDPDFADHVTSLTTTPAPVYPAVSPAIPWRNAAPAGARVIRRACPPGRLHALFPHITDEPACLEVA